VEKSQAWRVVLKLVEVWPVVAESKTGVFNLHLICDICLYFVASWPLNVANALLQTCHSDDSEVPKLVVSTAEITKLLVKFRNSYKPEIAWLFHSVSSRTTEQNQTSWIQNCGTELR
jgi:hypothetical protein